MPSAVPTAHKLVFNQQLLQPGKQSGGGDALQSRLKELHSKLAALDQDHVDVKSLQSVRKPLISNVILHHKDRGVKAYAACCLADMLKLFAPEAPYSLEELNEIFVFFHEQIMTNFKPLVTHSLMSARSRTQAASQAVHGRITEIPYYQEYCYLLESLATIKSIVLVADVPRSEQLMVDFFEGFMKIVRADMSKNVIRHIADILMAVIDEAQPVPAGVMDCLINQFEKFGSKPDTPSFMLTVDVVNGTADKLQRLILAHFAEIQLSHGRDPTDEDIETLESSHDLMLTMFTYTPRLLDNVVPQLEDALRAVDEAPLRTLTTQTLGRMFATRAHTPDGGDGGALARAFPATWKAWLGRRGDKVVEVRLAWCKTAREILENHPDLRDDLEPALRERCTDPDEKVRAASCKLFGEIDYETALHFVSLETLKAVAGRLADKKSSVRAQAFGALRRLYSLAYSEIETNEQEAIFKFAWIPAELLLCMFSAPGAEVRTMVDNSIYNDILPLPAQAEDEAAWVDRLLLVVSYLPPRAFTALLSLMNLSDHAQGTLPHIHFLRACEMNNGGIIDENEEAVKKKLHHIATMTARNYFADSTKALKDILLFAEINDRRLYTLFKACIDPSSDLNMIIKSKAEFLRRIEKSHPEILDTCAYLLQRGSFFLLNRSSISTLLQRIESSEQPKQVEAAIVLLRHINKACPVMHKTHVAELVKATGEESRPELVELALQGLAHVCRTDPEVAPGDQKLAGKVIEWVSTGTPRQAKFATRYLITSSRKDGCQTLLTHIDNAKSSVKDQQLLAFLAALVEIARFAPHVYETASVSITEWIFKDILWAKSPSAGEDLEDIWVGEDELLFGDRAKLAAIRVCTYRAYAARKADNALQSMLPVLRMLDTIMAESGGLKQDTEEGGKARCHLRLRAGLSLLKLGTAQKFDKYLANGFEAVAFLVQDPCFQVRNAFLKKLLVVLPRMSHPPRWNIVPVLTAHDPEAENMSLGRQIVTMLYRQTPLASRIKHLDIQLARLLSLLAHHPDFSTEAEDLKPLAKYIEFYLDLLGNADNIGLLYTVAGMLKAARDASEGYPSENIYYMSELAQIIIKGRAEAHNWTLSLHPEKLQLPRDSFRPHASPEAAQQIAKTTYLPDDTVKFFGALGRKAVKEPAPKRPKAARALKPKKTVKTEDGGKSKSKKRATAKGGVTDEDDESSTSDSESEEDEEEEEDDAQEEIVPVSSRKRASPDSDDDERPEGREGKRLAKSKPLPKSKSAKTKAKAKTVSKKRAQTAGSDSSELSELDSE